MPFTGLRTRTRRLTIAFALTIWVTVAMATATALAPHPQSSIDTVTAQLESRPIVKEIDLLERGALAWTELFIADGKRPPTGSRYVIIDGDGTKDCDRLRLSYQLGERRITLTQTTCVFAVQVDRPSESAVPTMADVQRALRDVLRDAESLELTPFPKQRPRWQGNATGFDNAKAPWLSALIWWADAGRCGAYFIKTDGKPSKQDKGLDLDANVRWFPKRR